MLTFVDVIIVMWLCRRMSLFLGNDAKVFWDGIPTCLPLTMKWFNRELIEKKTMRKTGKENKEERKGKREGRSEEGKSENVEYYGIRWRV